MNRREMLYLLSSASGASAVVPAASSVLDVADPSPRKVDLESLQPREWVRFKDYWVMWTGYQPQVNSLDTPAVWVAVPALPGKERGWDDSRAAFYCSSGGWLCTMARGETWSADYRAPWTHADAFSSAAKRERLRWLSLRVIQEMIDRGPYPAHSPNRNQEFCVAAASCSEQVLMFMRPYGFLHEKFGDRWDENPDRYLAEVRRLLGPEVLER